MTHSDAMKQGLVGCYVECARVCPSSIEHREIKNATEKAFITSRHPETSGRIRTGKLRGRGRKSHEKWDKETSHRMRRLTHKRREEKGGKQEGKEKVEGMGESSVSRSENERARAVTGAHDRRYKVDKVLFFAANQEKWSGSRMSSFCVNDRPIRESAPALHIIPPATTVGTGGFSFTPHSHSGLPPLGRTSCRSTTTICQTQKVGIRPGNNALLVA